MKFNVETYQDKRREYRWRLKAPNGNVIAESGEGYSTLAGLDNALHIFSSQVNVELIREAYQEAIGKEDF